MPLTRVFCAGNSLHRQGRFWNGPWLSLFWAVWISFRPLWVTGLSRVGHQESRGSDTADRRLPWGWHANTWRDTFSSCSYQSGNMFIRVNEQERPVPPKMVSQDERMAPSAKIKVRETGESISGILTEQKHGNKEPKKCWGSQKAALMCVCVCVCVWTRARVCEMVGVEVVPKQSENTAQRKNI